MVFLSHAFHLLMKNAHIKRHKLFSRCLNYMTKLFMFSVWLCQNKKASVKNRYENSFSCYVVPCDQWAWTICDRFIVYL